MVGFDQVLVLFLLILFGAIIKKAKLINIEFEKGISEFVINVALPAFVLTSVSISVSDEMLKNAIIFLFIGIAMFGLSISLSYLFAKFFKIKGQSKDIFQFILTFPNTGFMGYPVVAAVYGKTGVFYAAMFNLNFNLLLWSFGVYLMKRNSSNYENRNEKIGLLKRLNSIMNPALYALIIGFTMAALKVQMPSILNDTIKMVGNTTSPLSMMFIGFILADVHIKELIGDARLYFISFIRLIGFPLIFYFIAKSFISGEMLGISVLLIGMPAAVNTAIFAARYGNDYRLAGKIVFLSTLMSIITIPVLIKLVGV